MTTGNPERRFISLSGKIAAWILIVLAVVTFFVNYPWGAPVAFVMMRIVLRGALLIGAIAYLSGHTWGWFVVVIYILFAMISTAFLATRSAEGWFALALAFLVTLLLCLILPPIRDRPTPAGT